jgi:hypothetical protein
MKGDNPLVHRIPVKDSNGRVVGEKAVVAYRGLLDMVHSERLSVISTELIQAPTKENGETAIVSASVTTSRGTFSGIGDANPRNVDAKVAPHIIRMAETRAEARAMRKAVNIGVVAMEELGDDLDDSLTYEGTLQPSGGNGHHGSGAPSTSANHAAPPPQGAPQNGNGQGNGLGAYRGSADSNKVTDSQRRFLFRLLAERGMHGEQAREFIHKELGVASLDDAKKSDVSAFIDHLKNSNGQNGTPPEPGSRG